MLIKHSTLYTDILIHPSKKKAPKIRPKGADFQAAAPKDRRLFGANFTPKTRLLHA